jgi:glycosyltransferase involved in cell wall biosynthesis
VVEYRDLNISCVICTFRHPKMLCAALESMLCQTLSPDEFEVIVVDNNSGDQTETVVKNYQDRAPFPIIYRLELKQGLSNARNAGIQQARGKYVAFLDDDAEADKGWLSTFINVFEAEHETCVVGGKILPKWDAPRPAWLTDDLLNNLSMLDLGESRKILTLPDHVLGTSCFRKSVFDEIGKFEPQLGRSGDMLVGDEDTEIQRRVHAAGKQVIYTPEAVVWHHVSPDRLTKQYIYTRAYGTGCSRAVLSYEQGKYGTNAWRFIRAILGLIYYSITLLLTIWDERKRIKTVRSIYTKLGYIRQLWFYLTGNLNRQH